MFYHEKKCFPIKENEKIISKLKHVFYKERDMEGRKGLPRFHARKIIKITSIILKYLIPIFQCTE